MTDSFVDTNILIYAFDTNEPEKRPIARLLIQQAWQGQQTFHISNQILAEFSRALTQKKIPPYPPEKTSQLLQDFQEGWIIHTYSIKTIYSTLKLLEQYSLSFWDALIAATMIENQVYQIYTEDEAFNKIPGIKAVNPFRKRK